MAGWAIFTGRVSSAVRGVPFFPGVGSPIVASCLAFPLSAPPFAVSSLDVIAASPSHPCRCPWNASAWTEPARRPESIVCPCVQFRKDLRHPQKPSSGRWLRRGQRFFRNWGPGDGACGQFNQPGLPNIVGNSQATTSSPVDGAFRRESIIQAGAWNGSGDPWRTSFDASRCSSIYGTSDTVMPPSINQPVCLYLGRPAQV